MIDALVDLGTATIARFFPPNLISVGCKTWRCPNPANIGTSIRVCPEWIEFDGPMISSAGLNPCKCKVRVFYRTPIYNNGATNG